MELPSYSKTYRYTFVSIVLLLVADAFLQYSQGVTPCILSYMERSIMLVLAIVTITAGLYTQTPTTKKLFNWSILFICFLGMLVAGRHVWLQYFPPANIMFSVQNLPTLPRFEIGLLGTESCIQVHWSLGNISLAMWTFISFISIGIVTFFQIHRQND